jgi:hypothetical protein
VSVWVLTQASLQTVSPMPQARRQTPALHSWPVAQAVPQAPQLAALVLG